MSAKTKIQWCDTTVNPVMGCGGCELFPKPATALAAIDDLLIRESVTGWTRGRARQLLATLLAEAWRQLLNAIGEPGPGHRNALTLTNIWHLRMRLESQIAAEYGQDAGALARTAIERQLTCYAAKLHLNKGYSILNPRRTPNSGYAPTFEQVTLFPGRLAQAARMRDLLGSHRAGKPWLDGLPRLIFVSDMGDALSRQGDFDSLHEEIKAIQSKEGQRHLWLWLSKRPHFMQHFARYIGGMPSNVCAMTTVTSHDTLYRVDELRSVDAAVRGLSIEPLWSNIADQLDLSGIDWVIVGGESGARAHVTPFPLEWVEDLHAACRNQNVAFFCKQLGSRPTRGGAIVRVKDGHGGDWDEWDEALRVRQFPTYFHEHRCHARSETLALAAS